MSFDLTDSMEDPEILRSYLLGTLPEEDADEIERRLLADDAFFELAEAVEGDLLAALAQDTQDSQGALTPEERKTVLARLAASPRGRERLALAEGLTGLASQPKKLIPFPAPAKRPAFRFAALGTIAAGLLAVCGGVWLSLHGTLPGGGAALEARNEAAGAARRLGRPAPAPFAFQLALSGTRSAGQEHEIITIPSGTLRIEIQLPLNRAEPFTKYRATVLDASSDTTVWQDNLVPRSTATGARMVVVSLSAAKLPRGRYRIDLRGIGADGELERVGAPSFDVRTP